MAIEIPATPEQLEQKSLADLQRALPTTANPFLPESWMGAQAIANARRVFECYQQLNLILKEAIPVTAVQNLEMWASFWNVNRYASTQSTGNVIATGIDGSLIPSIGTTLQSSSGNTYAVVSDVNIVPQALTCSISSIGFIATGVFTDDVEMYTGQSFVISGCTESNYNGTFAITVIDANSFSYTIGSPTSSPATGSPVATFSSALVAVQSIGFGQSQNLSANSAISFTSPIVGVNNTCFVSQGAVGGGTDEETNTELKSRFLDRVQNPTTLFNDSAIIAQCKKVAGVTQVWVEDITPTLGFVTIYFIRGNDSSPIPSASEIADVQTSLELIRPAFMAQNQVIVLAPTALTVNFNFQTLVPNTSSMQSAVIANIQALFRDDVTVSNALTQNEYIAGIQNTIDPLTGERIQSFSLNSPVGDIGGGVGEYPVLGGVVFN